MTMVGLFLCGSAVATVAFIFGAAYGQLLERKAIAKLVAAQKSADNYLKAVHDAILYRIGR